MWRSVPRDGRGTHVIDVSDIGVYLGLDVGKGEHHATAVTPAGKKAFDKRLPNRRSASPTSPNNTPRSGFSDLCGPAAVRETSNAPGSVPRQSSGTGGIVRNGECLGLCVCPFFDVLTV
jgi:hypothetical protein